MRKNITEHFAWIVWQGLTCVNVSRCKIRYNTSPLNTGTNIDIIWKTVRSNLCFFPLNLCLTVDLLFLQVGKKSHDTSSRYLAFFSKLCWRQWFLPMLPSCVRTYVLARVESPARCLLKEHQHGLCTVCARQAYAARFVHRATGSFAQCKSRQVQWVYFERWGRHPFLPFRWQTTSIHSQTRDRGVGLAQDVSDR